MWACLYSKRYKILLKSHPPAHTKKVTEKNIRYKILKIRDMSLEKILDNIQLLCYQTRRRQSEAFEQASS